MSNNSVLVFNCMYFNTPIQFPKHISMCLHYTTIRYFEIYIKIQ